jgi:hypothetical protein
MLGFTLVSINIVVWEDSIVFRVAVGRIDPDSNR